jgi:hypothetical protein
VKDNQDNQEEQEEHENGENEETIDFTKPDYSFIPKGRHEYRQQGFYLVCRSCEIQHAVWIGAEKIMVGVTEEGTPIFEKR